MIQDLSSDVKKFLLTYPMIHQLTGLAQGELNRIHATLEAEIANQPWFSSLAFQTRRDSKVLQIWKKHWHPSVTQKCPWIHFEYGLSWSEQWLLTSVDIEGVRVVAREDIQDLATTLYDQLLSQKPKLLAEGQGWIINPTLEANRMLLFRRKPIDNESFSAQWMFDHGIEFLNQLSEIVPTVDKTVRSLFEE